MSGPVCVCGADLDGYECRLRAHVAGPRPRVTWVDLFGAAPDFRTQEDDDLEALAAFVRTKQAEAWDEGWRAAWSPLAMHGLDEGPNPHAS